MPPLAITDDLGAAGVALLDKVAEAPNRSRAFAVFDAAEEVPRGEMKRIRDWYESEYLQVIAQRNNAAWLAFDDPAQKVAGRSALRVTPKLLAYCVDAPPAGYGSARWLARDVCDTFMRRPTTGRLRSLAFGVLNARGPHASLSRIVSGSVLRLLLAVAAVLLALPTVPGEVAHINVAIVGFVVLILSSVPWSDLGMARGLREVVGGATLSIAVGTPGGEHGHR